MKKKHFKFPGSHVTRVIGSTQETHPSRSQERAKLLGALSPLSRPLERCTIDTF
ncbi:hypothetical protein [Mastigocoleus testarum]|uniref:hypothetical protein n=1 Tax=Mastigocoleus testarum TaxID=996925 RepID=UPI00137ADB5E|nr:hypothetical protein [Mastigocoleus testarum]